MDEMAKASRLSAARAVLAHATGMRERPEEGGFEQGRGAVIQQRADADKEFANTREMDERGLVAAVYGDREASRRLFIRMTLINDYRLSSAFIPVPKLALILGISPSTIWSHMRQQKFPIPYRMFNTTPMVCIDDLVDWYCAKDDLIFPDETPPTTRSAKNEAEDERRRRDAETDDIVANALASLGIDPSRRRRPR